MLCVQSNMCTYIYVGAHIALQVGKIQSILCERVIAMFSEYKRQRIVSFWHDGHKAPTVTRILVQESLPASRQGVQKFLKKYIENGAIGRQEGSGRKSKITAEVRRLVDGKMMEDDETTAKELKIMLAEHGHHVSETTEMPNGAWVDTLW